MSEWDEIERLEEVKALVILNKRGEEIYAKLPEEHQELKEWSKVFNELVKNTFKEVGAVPEKVVVEYLNNKIVFCRCMEDYLILLTTKLVDTEKLFGRIREVEVAKRIREAMS